MNNALLSLCSIHRVPFYRVSTVQVVRDKNVIKPAPGTRECNCRNKIITRQLGPGMFQQMQHRECEQCEAIKLERESVALSVHVEPGMRDGQEIRFFEEGEIMVDGEPGDLRVRGSELAPCVFVYSLGTCITTRSQFIIQSQPDKRFERHGDDLHLNHTISLLDALVGFSHEIHHLDGHAVTLAREGVTKPLQVVTLPGEGMPKPEDVRVSV